MPDAYLRETGRVAADEPIVRSRADRRRVEHGAARRAADAAAMSTSWSSRPAGSCAPSQPWFSSVERIWREAEVLKVCTAADCSARRREADRSDSRPAVTPRIVFEDRDNYLFAHDRGAAAAAWSGRPSCWPAARIRPMAAACGRLLATLHGGSWRDGGDRRGARRSHAVRPVARRSVLSHAGRRAARDARGRRRG